MDSRESKASVVVHLIVSQETYFLMGSPFSHRYRNSWTTSYHNRHRAFTPGGRGITMATM